MMKGATVYKIALLRGPMNGLPALTTSTPREGWYRELVLNLHWFLIGQY